MFSHIVLNGKERGVTATISENLEEFLVSVSVCGGEHEEHDTEMVLNVLLRESVIFFEQLDTTTGSMLQNLSIRMLFVPESVPRLCVDGFGGDKP